MGDSAANTQQTVLQLYETKLEDVRNSIAELQREQWQALSGCLSGICLFATLLYFAQWRSFSVVISILPLAGALWALGLFLEHRRKSLEAAHLCTFYEQGLDRLQSNWSGKGNNGTEFARDHHLYQYDLAVIGDGSLFELLCTTRSQAGAERLASFLLDPTEVEQASTRQEAVRELQQETHLREQIATLGKYQFQRCDGRLLRDWLTTPMVTAGPAVSILLFCCSLGSLVLFLLGVGQFLHWTHVLPLLTPFLLVQGGIAFAFKRRIGPQFEKLLSLSNELTVLRQGIALMQRQQFRSVRLRSLSQSVEFGNAAVEIRGLERLIDVAEHATRTFFYVPCQFLALATQLTLSIGRWRRKHGEDFLRWLDAWAEFDALNALACYAYEHPNDVFPELWDGPARLTATTLCHPLLPDASSRGNDITLNMGSRFYLISGSNMAGKSTLLRTLGLNAILAAAGAPVRARSLSLSVFRVSASLSIQDSLGDGKSRFLAEIERIRETIRLCDQNQPVLFLIDEILSGTNSGDRRVTAEWVIKTLVSRGAVGALSTHDLALTAIADDLQLQGVNVHMQSDNPDDPLDFDYHLKPGILRQANALAIAKMIGICL